MVIGRVNSSHQSNHGASEVDSSGGLPADQRIGSDSSVADAIRVALSASTGSELENAGQGGRPESDARWTKVGDPLCRLILSLFVPCCREWRTGFHLSA